MTDASPWAGLRPSVRRRLTMAVEHLRRTGTLRREDIRRDGEVSANQATADIRLIRERLPELMRYDPRAKHYTLAAPPPAPVQRPDFQGAPLAEVMRTWRAGLGLTRETAADLLGVRPRTWRHWEEGHSPSPDRPLRIALEALWDRRTRGDASQNGT